MNKFLTLCLLSAGMAMASSAAEAQHFYVKVHPAATVIVRPAPPSPRHVWVASEWAWSGGRYVETPGHWVLPPRGRRNWVPGHWVTSPRRGDYWVPGRWR